MNWKIIIGILVILEFVAMGAFCKKYIPRSNRLCGCDSIQGKKASNPVCGKFVFYDACEFACVQSMYPQNSKLTEITCPAGTKNPGRATINEPYPTTGNYMCNCEVKKYSVEPKPVCATASFYDGCQYNCAASRYLDVSVVPC